MRNFFTLLLLVASSTVHATLWRVDAVLSAHGINYETPFQKTKFPAQGVFETENGEPIWWNIDITLPTDVLELDNTLCFNVPAAHCEGKSIRGGFSFSRGLYSPGGSWSLTLVSAGVLTAAQFYRGGVGGFEGELEHGTMIPVAIPEPSAIWFALVALGFVVARARTVFASAAESEKVDSFHPHARFDPLERGNARRRIRQHGRWLETNRGVLES
jgi:hypothetical protein